MTVCEAVVRPHEFDYAKWKGNGRHPASRLKIFKAFLLKADFCIQDEAPRRDVPVEDVKFGLSMRKFRKQIGSLT